MKVILIILFIFATCNSTYSSKKDKNTIVIRNGGTPQYEMMYFDKNHWTMTLLIKENTLDDTAMVGGVLYIPPGKIGLLMKGDCFMDSMPFSYQPFRATKGKLVIQYYSQEY